jgi:hypothetical protein
MKLLRFLPLLFHKLVEPNSRVTMAMEPSSTAGCFENTVKNKKGYLVW